MEEKVVIIVEAKGADKAGNDLKGIGTKAAETSKAVEYMKRVIAGAISVYGFKKMGSYIDQWVELKNRINLSAASLEQYGRIQLSVQAIARETRSDIVSTAMAYNRAALSTENLGYGEEKVSKIVKAVNQTLKISGATAQEAKASLVQFFQGMASGQLRGDEFRSIAEQNMRMTKLLRDEIAGGNMGKLRAMAYDGKLTSEMVTKAILKNVSQLDSEFKKITPTISETFTNFTNKLIVTAGAFNEATGFGTKFYEILDFIAANIGKLSIAMALLIAPGLISGLKLVGSIFGGWQTTLITLNPYLLTIVATVGLVTAATEYANRANKEWLETMQDTEKALKMGQAQNKINEVQSQIDAMPFFLSGKGQQDAMRNLTDLKEKLQNVVKTGSDPEGLLPLNEWEKGLDKWKVMVKDTINEVRTYVGGRKDLIFESSLIGASGKIDASDISNKYLQAYLENLPKISDAQNRINELTAVQVALNDENFNIITDFKGRVQNVFEGEEKIWNLMKKYGFSLKEVNTYSQTEVKNWTNVYNLLAALNQELFKSGKATKAIKDIKFPWKDFEGVGRYDKYMTTPKLAEASVMEIEVKPVIKPDTTVKFWEELQGGLILGFEDIADKYSSLIDEMQDYTVSFFDSFGTTLTDNTINMFGKIIAPDLFKNATDSWREFAHQMSNDLANLLTKMLLYRYILDPIMGSFGYNGKSSWAGSRSTGGFMSMLLPSPKVEDAIVQNGKITPFRQDDLVMVGTNLDNRKSGGSNNYGGSAQVMNYIVLDSELPNIMANSKANEKATMNIIKLNANQVKQMLGI